MQYAALSLEGSLLHFLPQDGVSLKQRTAPWVDWLSWRRAQGVWPCSRILHGSPTDSADVSDEFGQSKHSYVNFGSQDYLSLSSDPRVATAAKRAIDEYGVHSAGSPVLIGRTDLMVRLEERLAGLLQKPACAVFPTGWAAGFGLLAGLVRETDIVVIDKLAHSCLTEGARHNCSTVLRFEHNDVAQLAEIVRQRRRRSPDGGIFIVLESLYSMDSDVPDVAAIVRIARQNGAITVLDIAHDFGSMGQQGRGLLDSLPADSWPDVLMGSFSKTFACNGGFVAAEQGVVDYLRFYSSPFMFSNALSPVQCSIALACCEIVFSAEGAQLRCELANNVAALRAAMSACGLQIGGTPSPIVPVFVGGEALARLTAKHINQNGLLANLVEFPAVPKGKARFRFQVMRNHKKDAIDRSACIMRQSCEQALKELASFQAARTASGNGS